MAFCASCGAQLEGNQRFCGKCGSDQTAKVGNGPAAPVGAPQYGAPPPGPTPQMPYVAAGQVPMSMAMPPQAPAKKSGMMWLGVIVAVAAGYYYYTHYVHPQNTQPGPSGQSVPENPGQQPAGNPGQQPAGNPGQQPGGGGGDALAAQQQWTGTISEDNGQVEITNGKWVNNSNVAIQSASLVCVQYDANKQALAQDKITIDGPNNTPVAPQSTITFDAFSVGAVVQGAVGAGCAILAATPVN